MRAGTHSIMKLAVALTIAGISRGICSEECGRVFKSNTCPQGVISSPGFPLAYQSRTVCKYEFIGNGTERIQLSFIEFSLTGNDPEECFYSDTIEISMYTNGKYRPTHLYCGTKLPGLVLSSNARMLVEFRGIYGGHLGSTIGFKFSFTFLRNFGITSGTQIDDSCSFNFTPKDTTFGTFSSPNFPGFYPNSIECNYFFHANEGETVLLTFSYFDVEGVFPCYEDSASDYVEFSNQPARDDFLKVYCGRLESPFNMTSIGSYYRVTFRSNDRLDGTGFKASYKFIGPKKSSILRVEYPGELLIGNLSPKVFEDVKILMFFVSLLLRF